MTPTQQTATPCCCGKYTFPTFEVGTLDWSWSPITDDDGVHEWDRCLSGLRDDAMDDVVRPSDVVEECRCQDRPSGSDAVGDIALSRRQAEDLLEIFAEFRSQHLREAGWDYPMFDYQRRMLTNLNKIEIQVYRSMRGVSDG